MKHWLKSWWFIIVGAVLLCGSGVIPAIIPQAVPPAYRSGPATGSKFALTTGSFTTGNLRKTAADGSEVDTGITVDSSNNIGTPGAVQTGVAGGVAGSLDLTAGTAPVAQAANTFRLWLANPATVAYKWSPPIADAAGIIQSDGAGQLGITGLSAFRRSFGATFDGGGSVLVAGKAAYATIPYACTGTGIDYWNITVDDGTNTGQCASCTATVDIWKIATGTTATPTSAAAITGTGAGRPAISTTLTDTSVRSSTFTGWSTQAVSAADKVVIYLYAVTNAKTLAFTAECQ